VSQVAKLVRLSVNAGQRDHLLEALAPVRELAAADPGTELWTIHLDHESPDRLFIYERYRDQAAADAHDQSPVLKDALQRTGAFLAGPPEIFEGDVLESTSR
jgi:quinol monooxygenase YgiN